MARTHRSRIMRRSAQAPIGPFDRTAPIARPSTAVTVRSRCARLADVSSIGKAVAERIVAEREARGPYRDMADVSRRAGLNATQLEALAAAGSVRRIRARTARGAVARR